MRAILTIAMLTVCSWTATVASAANTQNLGGQMFSLAKDIQGFMSADDRVKGQKLALGRFDGEGDAAASNFGLQIARQLGSELSAILTEKSKFTLVGSYHYVQSEDAATPNAKILLITVQIKNDRGREIKAISVEVNDTDNIYQVLGLTGAAPQVTKKQDDSFFEIRNKAAEEAQQKPTFGTAGTRVTAQGAPQWAVGVLKKSSFDGATSPVPPQNVKGLAFAPIGVGDYYEIELVNHDSSAAVANVTVDGLEVANTFSTDKGPDGKPTHYPGYVIGAGQTFVIRGWLHKIDQTAKDNVFSFRVVDLGQGAASAMRGRGSVGVITVQFREACEPGETLSGRSFTPPGETGKGEALQEKLEAKPMQIGENVLSTVSIRYNRPE